MINHSAEAADGKTPIERFAGGFTAQLVGFLFPAAMMFDGKREAVMRR